MSKADQFRQYAQEAMRWARQSKTENEKQVLTELARTWMQAAMHSERFSVNDSPPIATALRGHEQAGRESAPLRQKRTRRFGGPRSPVHRLIVIGGQPLLVFCKGGEASLQVLELSLFRESDRPSARSLYSAAWAL